jgi:hypothetical protein
MKKMILLSAAVLFAFTFAYSQKVAETDVPSAVLMTFKTKFTNTTGVAWEKDSANYEASFISNEMKAESLFSDKGAWIETEWDIPLEFTPDTLKKYISANLSGYKIKETTILDKTEGKFYVIEVAKKKDIQEVTFSLDNKFVKKEASKECCKKGDKKPCKKEKEKGKEPKK